MKKAAKALKLAIFFGIIISMLLAVTVNATDKNGSTYRTVLDTNIKDVRSTEIGNAVERVCVDDIPMSEYDTPKMYGTIGDGENDDASAFIDAINNSDHISLTSDLYFLNPISISGKTHLVIDGNGYTINFKNIERALQITDSANIVFKNIIFDGNSCTTQGVLFINCENILIENCIFKNMTTTSATDGDTWGLNFRDSRDMYIDGCSFVNIDGSDNSSKVANGLVVHGRTKPCENVTILNCYFDTISPVKDACGISLNQTNFYDTPLYGVVENCQFVDCAKRAVKIMAQYVTVNNCNIVDIWSNEQHASMIDIMAAHCKVTNNTINVNRATYGISCQYVAETTLTGFDDIIIENNYIYVANEDGTIARDGLTIGLVDDTKKYTNVVVKNNVVKGRFRYSFKAMYIADSVIYGNTFEDGEVRIGNSYQEDRPCDNINVISNTMSGSITLAVNSSLIAHNTFLGQGGPGIYFSTLTNGTISNIMITCNSFDNFSNAIITNGQNLDNVVISKNVFTNTILKDMQLFGTNYVIYDNVLSKGVAGTFSEVNRETLPTLGHDEIAFEANAPTCLKSGWDAYVTCSRCDYTTYVEIPATGHYDENGDGFCELCGERTSIITSGQCGDNVTWKYDENGTITISGEGDMWNFTDQSEVPWSGYLYSLKSIVIEDGVTSVGDKTFVYGYDVTNITLADSVTRIGAWAFYDCHSVTNITLPKNLTAIGDGAFYYCRGFTNVVFPEKLTTIGMYAFYSCTGLTSVNIPESVNEIGVYAFYSCTGLKDVTISEGITEILTGVFGECDSLENVTIPASVTTIDKNAFYNCWSITYVYFDGTLSEWKSIDISTTGNENLYYAKSIICLKDEDKPDEHEHSYTATVLAPDCVTEGFTIYTCEACGDNYVSDVIPATGHYDENGDGFCEWCKAFLGNNTPGHECQYVVQNEILPTCTKDGEILYVCPECASCYLETLPATGHDEIAFDAKAPTCTESGWNAYVACSRCDYTTYVEIPATGHYDENGDGFCDSCMEFLGAVEPDHVCDYVVTVTDPTCTERGYTTYACKYCDNSFVDNYTGIKAHNYGYWPGEVTDPTCTERGYTTYTCGVCGHSFKDNYTEIKGHNYGYWPGEVTDPTCTEGGYTTYTCCDCGHSFKDNYTEIKGHNYGYWPGEVTDPTCISKGYTTYTCCECGYSFIDNYTEISPRHSLHVVKDALGLFSHYHCELCGRNFVDYCSAGGHEYEMFSTTAPTCTMEGYTEYACKHCPDSIRTDYVAVVDHEFEVVSVTAPTCTMEGYSVIACKHCYASYSVDYTDKVDHEYEVLSVTAPTCTMEGYSVIACKHCYESYSVDYTDKVDHEFEVLSVTAPTCTMKGYSVIACKHCYASYSVDYTDKVDHEYEVVSVTEPTCTTQGYTEYACKHCPDHYCEYTNVVPHQFKLISSIDATCLVDGSAEYACETCGMNRTETIYAPGHTVANFAPVDATCTETGLTPGTYCSVCKEVLNAQIETPALGHDPITHAGKAPTCTEIGWEAYVTCSRCDYTTYVEIPANGHTSGETVTENSVDATCIADGKYDTVVYCTVCKVELSRVTIPVDATGHSYATRVTAPTCTEKGYTTYTCHCSDSYISDYVDATGHSFGEWHEVTAPTCTTVGSDRRDCANCDHYETKSVDALDHDFSPEWTVDFEATTTTLGQKSRHCSRCDEITDIIEIAKKVEIIDTSEKFVDVTDSWSKVSIDYVVSHGYMNGTGNGSTFSPTGTMSRSMIVTVLYRIDGQPTAEYQNPFTDVNTGWYYDAVLWAYENTIVTGTGATTFSPDGNVTREQMATFLYRFAKHMNFDTSIKADITTFPDESDVASWSYEALAWANAEGLITGAVIGGETCLNPQGAATREQVATILMRFCQAYE